MRTPVVILLGLLLAGCASRRPAAILPPADDPPATRTVAQALVFAPVESGDGLLPDRHLRQPRAFVAYEELDATFIHVRTIDRQTNDSSDRYERKAVMHRTGASVR